MKLVVKKESTLLNYLEENLEMPKKRIKEYLKYGSIYVDGTKTTQYNYPLMIGTKIIIDTKEKKKVTLPFPILYEDNNIIVVDKPSNLLTIKSSKEKEETVYHLVSNYLKSTNKHAKVFIVHRLDKDTSGVLLLAKSEYMKNLYQKDWNEKTKRMYTALVHGIPRKQEEKLIDKLKETKTNLVYIAKEGTEAITNYKVLESTKNYSKLEIEIETGRKNQIRVQLANIKTPIVGDKKYGIKEKEKRLFLHAHSLTIYNPIEKKTFTYTAKIPKAFHELLKQDRGVEK